MNMESYSYVLITAILGMSVVFIFLWFLSVLMTVIKLIFDEKPQENDGSGDVGQGPNVVSGSAAPGDGLPQWVRASAAAYVADKNEGVPQWVRAAVAAYVVEEASGSQR